MIEQALRAVWSERDQRDCRERIPEIDLINIAMDKDPRMNARKVEGEKSWRSNQHQWIIL